MLVDRVIVFYCNILQKRLKHESIKYYNYPRMTTEMATEDKETVNFMGGKSYKLSPLDSLKVVTTSMICGESQYYRRKLGKADKVKGFIDHFLFPQFYEESPTDYFEQIVNNALESDFEASVKFVAKLRNEYFMRLNSNYLLTKAIHHPSRVEFNKKNPKVLKTSIEQVGCLPTDWTTQYKLLKEAGKPIPTIWKRAIADKLHKMTAYHAAKYLHGSKTGGKVANAKTHDGNNEQVPLEQESDEPNEPDAKKSKRANLANLVDLVRITHPKPTDVINQLVKNGKVEVADDEQTWERLRSAKKTWQEINAQIRLPHMALLRNLRNIAEEYEKRQDADEAFAEIQELAERLVAGVKGGKQFPFRYFSAYKMLKTADATVTKGAHLPKTADKKEPEPEPSRFVAVFLDALNRCVLESVECIPPMNGRVDCLSDNSGSSRGGIVSEYGTVRVFEIANLSAILTAYRATEGGSVWIFGDKLEEYVVTNEPILEQLEKVNTIGNTIGGGTETGVWLFWEQAINLNKHLDTVFIYSDMQAGTGQLYVNTQNANKLKQMGAALGTYVDVLKLVQIYREKVNAKVNVFSVQVAGYDNTVLPDILYRGAILSGWTGKEAKLAYEINALWDAIETVPDVVEDVGAEVGDGWVNDW